MYVFFLYYQPLRLILCFLKVISVLLPNGITTQITLAQCTMLNSYNTYKITSSITKLRDEEILLFNQFNINMNILKGIYALLSFRQWALVPKSKRLSNSKSIHGNAIVVSNSVERSLSLIEKAKLLTGRYSSSLNDIKSRMDARESLMKDGDISHLKNIISSNI